ISRCPASPQPGSAPSSPSAFFSYRSPAPRAPHSFPTRRSSDLRHFCQNDAHLFVTPSQIKSEVANVCDLIFEVYKDFGITDYRRSEEHTSELQSRFDLVCRLLLEKKRQR